LYVQKLNKICSQITKLYRKQIRGKGYKREDKPKCDSNGYFGNIHNFLSQKRKQDCNNVDKVHLVQACWYTLNVLYTVSFINSTIKFTIQCNVCHKIIFKAHMP
jgi:hypothetical protein